MTLNARQSPEDSLLKIKIDYNRAKFWENKQKGAKFDNETSKLQPVILSEILPVYIKEQLTLYKVFNVSFLCRNPTPQVWWQAD